MTTTEIPVSAAPARAGESRRPDQKEDSSGQPVLPLKLKKILVPTDFSAQAVKAINYAERLATNFGAELTLLHVFQPHYFAYEGLLSEEFRDACDSARDEVRSRLRQLCGIVRREAGLAVEGVIVEGVAHEQITALARSLDIDLIVIPTHGFTGLKQFVHLGSTAERVVRHASCPVLVVRQHECDFIA